MATLAEMWDADTSSATTPKNVKPKRQSAASSNNGMTDAEAADFLKEMQKVSGGSMVAPKKSTMTGMRPDLQPTDDSKPILGNTLADLWDAPEGGYKSTAGGGRGSYQGYSAVDETAGKTKQNVSKVRQIFANALQKGAEVRQQVPGFLASTADFIGNAPSAVAGTVGYGASRLFGGTPEEATASSQKVAGAIANPVGRLTGLSETPAYQQALPTQVMEYIGSHLNEGAQSISQKFNVPVADVENAINAGLMVTGAVAPKAIGAAKQAFKEASKDLEIVRPSKLTKEQAQADFEAKQANAGSAGAAKVETNPFAGKITGEESVRGQFPQVKLSKTGENVPVNEQNIRAQIYNEIVGNNQIRSGVLTGNEDVLRTEHTASKLPTPQGELLKKQIADEQVALSNYAQQRVSNSGASPTLITPYERGQRINDAFAGDEGLSGFFKNEKKSFYDEASKRTANNPIQSNNVENLFADKQFQAGLGLKNNQGLAKSAEDLINHAKTIGFKDELGNTYAPNTVGAWTAVQKYLNSNWTKENAGIIRQINQAIERDIGQAGGLDLLKKADQLHQAEKVLFESKGIKKMFGDIDPNGVQTATAFESIPQKLNSMPLDEWKHIYDTADKISKGKISGPIDKSTGLPKWEINVPEELRVSAESAKNEMRGNIAREIYEAGAAKAGEWNQNSVNKILNARAKKIEHAFSPEEQQAFHKLNYGGYLMPGVHAYEGAGLQSKRVQGIVEGNLGKVGTAAGGAVGTFVGGPPGGAVGAYIGGKVGAKGAEKLGERALLKAAEKTQKEMQRNAQMGQNNLSDMTKQGKP